MAFQLMNLPLVMDLGNYRFHRCQVFYLFFCITLLFNVFLHPSSVSTEPEPTDYSTIRVSDLPFSQQLSNPCDLAGPSSLEKVTLPEEAREEIRRAVFNETKSKVSLLKDDAEKLLETNVLEECASLQMPVIANIPIASNISESTPSETLHLFYTSLLKHAAHVFFMAEDNTCTTSDFSNNAKSLASNMRQLVCHLRVGILTIHEDGDSNLEELKDEFLNETLSYQSLSSRRSLRDCQTIRSTISLLNQLSSYLHSTAFGEL